MTKKRFFIFNNNNEWLFKTTQNNYQKYPKMEKVVSVIFNANPGGEKSITITKKNYKKNK